MINFYVLAFYTTFLSVSLQGFLPSKPAHRDVKRLAPTRCSSLAQRCFHTQSQQ